MNEPRLEPKRTRVRVTEIIDHVAGEMCQDYCKWPEKYTKDGDFLECEMYEAHCRECPLNLL